MDEQNHADAVSGSIDEVEEKKGLEGSRGRWQSVGSGSALPSAPARLKVSHEQGVEVSVPNLHARRQPTYCRLEISHHHHCLPRFAQIPWTLARDSVISLDEGIFQERCTAPHIGVWLSGRMTLACSRVTFALKSLDMRHALHLRPPHVRCCRVSGLRQHHPRPRV
jgi:hypothetical protein